MAKKHADKPGYGKLLDAWAAPEGAGDPIGCLATTFTFSPAFFEEECLARFLHLESDPDEDGPVYLVEREEKLAQIACAAVLVDQHHCQGTRSLRWDLLSARMPKGIQHAKVSLLYWTNAIRLLIGSANLTEDGYRRNQEVFGVLDFRAEAELPISCLKGAIDFLRQAALTSQLALEAPSPALKRWNALLDRALSDCRNWGLSDDASRRQSVRVLPLFAGPGNPSLFKSLKQIWPGGPPPDVASVVSPFFDPPDAKNAPAHELWALLRQRGAATVEFHVAGEDVPGENTVFLHAPESLLKAQPEGRSNLSTDFYRVVLEDGRPLHAKGIWLENDRWIVYLIGSSNFTSAGLGLGKAPNLEANFVYIVDTSRNSSARKVLNASFPTGEFVDLDNGVKWKPLSSEGEDSLAGEVPLPDAFSAAVFDCDKSGKATVILSVVGKPPLGWQLITDGDDRVFDETQWSNRGFPASWEMPWEAERPPSGFWVNWTGSNGNAWWPVNVKTGDVLPPPEELKNLPLDILINILSSARPLHQVLRDYLRRRKREKHKEGDTPVVDPHKRVDTSQFLLQRTRRISWALNSLRTRLERPVATLEFLQWRLRGPVGILALAKALVREAHSNEEKAFLISELALEVSRVKPDRVPGYVSPKQHVAEVRSIIPELAALVPEATPTEPRNLRQYVNSVFDVISA